MRIKAAGLPKITSGCSGLELLYSKYKKLKRCKVIKKNEGAEGFSLEI